MLHKFWDKNKAKIKAAEKQYLDNIKILQTGVHQRDKFIKDISILIDKWEITLEWVNKEFKNYISLTEKKDV